MRGTGLWWRCKLYTVGKQIAAQLYVMAVTGFAPLSPGLPTQRLNQLNYLPHTLTDRKVNRYATSSACGRLCDQSVLIMSNAWLRSDKNQILSHCFDSTRVWTHEVRNPESPKSGDGCSTHLAIPSDWQHYKTMSVHCRKLVPTLVIYMHKSVNVPIHSRPFLNATQQSETWAIENAANQTIEDGHHEYSRGQMAQTAPNLVDYAIWILIAYTIG